MLQNLTGWHALIILAIVVLIFGAAKLPALAKSVGQSMRILKSEVAAPGADSPGESAVAVASQVSGAAQGRADADASVRAAQPPVRATE